MLCLNRSLLALLFISLLGLSAYADNGYVRVNQIGYEAGLPARAYLMTRASGNAKFSIIDSSGATAASGSVGALLGTWGHYSVYPIDFTLSKHDVYSIVMSNGVSATSPIFRVDTPENLYTAPLANKLYFYENERDGADFIPTALRTAPGHLNDSKATVYLAPAFDDDDNFIGSLVPIGATINAEGGWWDAGDYLKFVQTESYVVALMLAGVRDFPHQMGAQSETSNFTDEAEFGVRWLQRMWDDDSRRLYYQVGIGTDFEDFDYLSDHDIWRLPQVDDTSRATTRRFSTFAIGQCFRPGLLDRRSARISPDVSPPISPSAFKCSRRRILRWRSSASSPPNMFSSLQTPRRPGIC